MQPPRKPVSLFAALTTVAFLVSGCDDAQHPLAGENPTVAAATSAGPIILYHPGTSPGAPFYGYFSRGFIVNDGVWAGLPFYRSPACVPTTFNLLNQFDPPAAFGCALTVEGKEWWHSLSDPFPYQVHDHARGLTPIYFVLLSELQAATVDDVLTMSELQALPSLVVGNASRLTHIIQNTNQPRKYGREEFIARGSLDDGRAFLFRYAERFDPTTGQHEFPYVDIRFQ